MTRLLFLVADGMGDWPLDELDGQTPLQQAQTPNMDRLARVSKVGLCQTIPASMPPGSDIANMALMGYDPATFHTGRGPIEAAAQGLSPGPDDLIWRCNLVSLEGLKPGSRMIDYSAGHISSEKAGPLISVLQSRMGNDEFRFYPGVQYRHLLVQKNGSQTRAAQMDVRPPHDILDQAIDHDLEQFQSYPALWDIVYGSGQLLHAFKADTGVDSIWPWGQGRPLSLPGFKGLFGFGGSVISAVDLIKGLGRAAGLKAPDIPGATGLLDTNYQGKVQAAKSSLEQDGFVFIHLEGPDECGHMGDIKDKIEAISRFDRLIVGPMLDYMQGRDFIMVICCDHLTPIKIRTHAQDPVPFMIFNTQSHESGPDDFSEEAAKKTGLVVEQGHKLLRFALEC